MITSTVYTFIDQTVGLISGGEDKNGEIIIQEVVFQQNICG